MADNTGAATKLAPEPERPARKWRRLVWAVAGVLLILFAAWGVWRAHTRRAFAALWTKLEALPQSPLWEWMVLVGFAALVVLAVAVLWKVPQWQVARVEDLTSKERFDKRNEARKTLATILGGVAFLTGGYFTWRNFNLAQESLRVSQQGQITDRFTKAIEQLGAVDGTGKPKFEVRLGGIYSLEAIARESKELHWPIMEVLCSYVRGNSPVSQAPAKSESLASKEARRGGASGDERHPRADIQAILTVIGRRDVAQENENQRLDLSGTDLVGAAIEEAHLERADFTKANLSEADFSGADLRTANLGGTDLNGADLRGADLRRAYLSRAFLGAADLWFANLGGVDLRSAQRLTQEQIDSAEGNVSTKLPSNMCLPRAWDGVAESTPHACSGTK